MNNHQIYKMQERKVYRSADPSTGDVLKKKLAQTTVLGTVSFVTLAGAPMRVMADSNEETPSDGALLETSDATQTNVVTLGENSENSGISEMTEKPTSIEAIPISEENTSLPEEDHDSGMSVSQLEESIIEEKPEEVGETPKIETPAVEEATAVTEAPTSVVPQTVTQSAPTTTTVPAYIPTTGSVYYVSNKSTSEFIEEVGEAARKLGQENDLYASVMIAQALLESGSGGSQLSQAPYYNLFGIKGSYNGNSVTFSTQEDNGDGTLTTIQSAFKAYDNYEGSFQDYVTLMKEGLTWNTGFYQGTWKSNTTSYEDATYFLTGRYATDIFYHLKLNGLIETYDLTRFDQPKETETPPVS